MKKSSLFPGAIPLAAAMLFLSLSFGLNSAFASTDAAANNMHVASVEISQGNSSETAAHDRSKKGKKKKKKNKHLCPAFSKS